MKSKSVTANITKTFYMLLFMSGIIALYTTAASAHGLGYRLLKNDTTKVVEFRYSNGSALPYAEVEVWSPDDAEIEFQNGRTDKNGRFSFFPDVPGIWRVTIADGMGHAASAQCEIVLQNEDSTLILVQPQEKGSNRITLIILGISLIFNLALLIRKGRESKQAQP